MPAGEDLRFMNRYCCCWGVGHVGGVRGDATAEKMHRWSSAEECCRVPSQTRTREGWCNWGELGEGWAPGGNMLAWLCLSLWWLEGQESSDPSDWPSTHNSGPYLTAHIISTRPRPPHHNAIHLHHRVHQHSLLICSCLSLRYGVTPTLPPASRALWGGVCPMSQTCPCRGNWTFCLGLGSRPDERWYKFLINLSSLHGPQTSSHVRLDL